MKKMIPLACFMVYSISTLLLLTGSTNQKTVDPECEWLPVNFFGSLEDSEGNKDEVENISISGEYQKIPFYIQPKESVNNSKDPSSNYEKIDLKDVAEISLVDKTIHTFKKRDYMALIVRFKNSDHKKAYIIERNKKIVCYRREENKPILKEVRIDALKSLAISGYKDRQENPNNQ